MATVAHRPYSGPERRSYERRNGYMGFLRTDGHRLSWGGVWGGVLVAVGVLLLLAALGVAVGISAANPGEMQASAFGTGAGVWAGLSLLVALFLGGLVATRTSLVTDGTTGFVEGALVWVISILLIGWLATSGITMVASGAFSLIGGATQAVGSVLQVATGPGVNISGSVEQMTSQLEDPQTAQQIAQATGLPESEVKSTLTEIAQAVENARDNPAEAAAAVRQGITQLWNKAVAGGTLEQTAERVQPEVAGAAWITFAALVLSLVAAALGAMVGRRRPKHARA